jgi:serine/threonine protein kinase
MSESPVPQRIGRYDIERVLGEGAMGVVYEGKDTRLHRKVAVKTILKSALDSDSAKEYSMRFRREAQAVARLNHPNIVQVFDFAEEGDIAYIVMEFVKGRELKHFFDASESFELKEVVHIMAELCDALHFAHEAGVIHRDIKPANVMIDTQGRVKLTDFGVARITDSDRTMSERTQAGAVVGTPSYMSPEQVQGNTLDRRTDIFSAGVILYEFLTGAKPFQGTGVWTIAKKIMNDHPPAPSEIRNSISPLYDAIVAKALVKAVEDRYQTARALGFALQRALEGLPEAEDPDRTLGGPAAMFRAAAGAAAAPQKGDATVLRTISDATIPLPRTQAVELEFWRSIKDGSDPADFDLYVQQFPSGIYAALAKRKSAKLRGVASEDDPSKTRLSAEQEKREVDEAQRRENEARAQLAAEKAELEAALAKREADFQQREAEAQANLAAEKARQEAELAKREALLKKREAENPKKSPLVPAAVAFLVAAAAFGAWQVLKPPDENAVRVVELTRLLEESKQRETELRQSRERGAEMAKELEQMRISVAEAQKAGDTARLKELAGQVAQREAEVQKQAEVTRQREAEAEKRRAEIARLQAAGTKAPPVKAAEPAKPAEPAPVANEPAKTSAPAKSAGEAAKSVEAKAAAEPTKVAALSPAPVSPNVTAPDAPLSADAMLQRAIALELEGKNVDAARLLRQVIRGASGAPAGQAAKRLGDLYQKGGGGVSRDYAEALKYYEIARSNGIDVPTTKGR